MSKRLLCPFRLIQKNRSTHYRTPRCGESSTLEFRENPARYVCKSCHRVFSLADAARLGGAAPSEVIAA